MSSESSPTQAVKQFQANSFMAELNDRYGSGEILTVTAQDTWFLLQLGVKPPCLLGCSPQSTAIHYGLVAMMITVDGCAAVFSETGLTNFTVPPEYIAHAQVPYFFCGNVTLSVAPVQISLRFALVPSIEHRARGFTHDLAWSQSRRCGQV